MNPLAMAKIDLISCSRKSVPPSSTSNQLGSLHAASGSSMSDRMVFAAPAAITGCRSAIVTPFPWTELTGADWHPTTAKPPLVIHATIPAGPHWTPSQERPELAKWARADGNEPALPKSPEQLDGQATDPHACQPRDDERPDERAKHGRYQRGS